MHLKSLGENLPTIPIFGCDIKNFVSKNSTPITMVCQWNDDPLVGPLFSFANP